MDINLLEIRATAKMLEGIHINTYILAQMYAEITNADKLDDDTLSELLSIGLKLHNKVHTNATATGIGVILADIANDIIEDSLAKKFLNYNYVYARYNESDWR